MGTTENVEVTAGTALIYTHRASLAAAMTRMAEWGAAAGELAAMAAVARKRAFDVHSWEAGTDAYEALFTRHCREEEAP